MTGTRQMQEWRLHTRLYGFLSCGWMISVCTFASCSILPGPAQKSVAERILSVFPEAARTEPLTVPGAEDDAARLRGGHSALSVISSYVILKDQTQLGEAHVIDVPGKHGAITVLVILDDHDAVKSVEIIQHFERRGRHITRGRFLNQFIGKTKSDNLLLGSNIQGITGATISSRAVVSAVKHVMK